MNHSFDNINAYFSFSSHMPEVGVSCLSPHTWQQTISRLHDVIMTRWIPPKWMQEITSTELLFSQASDPQYITIWLFYYAVQIQQCFLEMEISPTAGKCPSLHSVSLTALLSTALRGDKSHCAADTHSLIKGCIIKPGARSWLTKPMHHCNVPAVNMWEAQWD